MQPFSDLSSALTHIVETHGIEVLKSQAYINMLDDYHAFTGKPYLKNALKIFFNEGLIESILFLCQKGTDAGKIVDRIEHEYGFKRDLVQEIVSAILDCAGICDGRLISGNSTLSNKESNTSSNQQSSFKGGSSRLKFMGLELGCSLEEMESLLFSKGFKPERDGIGKLVRTNRLVYRGGSFSGFEDASITLKLTSNKRKVYAARVSLDYPSKKVLDLFKEKYGDPEIVTERTYRYLIRKGCITLFVGENFSNITYADDSIEELDRKLYVVSPNDKARNATPDEL